MGVDDGEEQMQESTDCEERIFVSVRLCSLNDKEIFVSVSKRSMYPTAYAFGPGPRPEKTVTFGIRSAKQNSKKKSLDALIKRLRDVS